MSKKSVTTGRDLYYLRDLLMQLLHGPLTLLLLFLLLLMIIIQLILQPSLGFFLLNALCEWMLMLRSHFRLERAAFGRRHGQAGGNFFFRRCLIQQQAMTQIAIALW